MKTGITLIAGLLCWLAGTAMAAEVYQCRMGASVSYQGMPCEQGRPMKVWRLVAPGALPASVAKARPRTRETTLRKPRAQASGGHLRAVDESCEAVRAQRAAAYEVAGLQRGFALSSHWDNRVQQACK